MKTKTKTFLTVFFITILAIGIVSVANVKATAPSISYSGSFIESLINNGSVIGSRIATLTGDTFVNASSTLAEGIDYALANVPTGLTPEMDVNANATEATLTFSGSAVHNLATDSVSDLTITFLDGSFTNTASSTAVTGYTNNQGVIDFIGTALSNTTSGGSYSPGSGQRATTPPTTPPPYFPPSTESICPNGMSITSNCTAPVSSSPNIPPATPATNNLRLGQNNPTVQTLQAYLNTHGFPLALTGVGSSGHETNYFGPLTLKALKAFQRAHHLIPDGIWGPNTRGAMK